MKQLRISLPVKQSRSRARKKWRQFDENEAAVGKPGDIHNVAAVGTIYTAVDTVPPLPSKYE
jgi:hypothetical protein